MANPRTPQPPGRRQLIDTIPLQIGPMAGAIRAMDDLLRGTGRQLSLDETGQEIDRLTGGGRMTQSPQQLQDLIGRTRETTRLTGHSYAQIRQAAQRGGDAAEGMGLSRSFGLNTALSSASFGRAWADRAGRQGFGGLSREQAEGLDQRLRLSAAKSATGNMLGATAKLAEAGLLKGLDLNTAKGKEILANFAHLRPDQWMQTMQKHGVSAATASNFLAAREANQEAVHRHGLQDVVRGAQGRQVEQMMAGSLAGGAMGSLRQSGMSVEQAGRTSQVAGAAMARALKYLKPELLADPTKAQERNQQLKKAVQADLARQGIRLPDRVLNETVANSYQALEQRVRSNPALKQFGNVAGLVSLNRQDILQAGAAGQREAGQRAAAANRGGGAMQTDLFRRISDAVQQAKPGDDLMKIAGRAVGGADAAQIRRLLGPNADKVLEGMRKQKAPAAKEANRHTDKKAEEERQKEAGQKGSGSNRLTIDGTLKVHQDGTADVAGSGQPGNVPTT